MPVQEAVREAKIEAKQEARPINSPRLKEEGLSVEVHC